VKTLKTTTPLNNSQPLFGFRFSRTTIHRAMAILVTAITCTTLLSSTSSAQQAPAAGQIAEFSGPTMGTRFTVKMFNPPEFQVDVRLEVDALLRHINDLMSTYLANSEITRFNESESTDWFPVSEETAFVAAFAQELAEKTDGAFDITIEPLVNAWSFGPKERKRVVPSDQELKQILSEIGHEKLEVRMTPPALKKALPKLEIDLSAVAKGYAVDQVVSLLNDLGANDVFVEIGGEVATSGDKAGQPWQVGIQVPDTDQITVLIAQPMNTRPDSDQAMATSGDYRNFFEVDGVRYSHTIDPRTGRPIEHNLASISVLGPSCMEADAWATALNVLGDQAGNALAQKEGLSTLAVQRDGENYLYVGTGLLTQHAADLSEPAQEDVQGNGSSSNPSPEALATDVSSWLVVIMAAVVFGVIIAGMAVGVMFGRRSISGSCGGLANKKDADGNTSCALCSSPSDACQELRDRMNQTNANATATETDDNDEKA
jgi:thiamine biosynthesis lipoprotein